MRIRNLIAAVTVLLTFASIADAADLLYVSTINDTIVTFDTTSNVGSTVPATKKTFASTNMFGVEGIALDSSGNLYAANAANFGSYKNTISKFNSSGQYIGNISTNLSSPYGLAFDSSGNLYASNYGNDTISKFNSAGAYVSSISSHLYDPAGMAFDSSGNLYVANRFTDSISKFNASGSYVSSINTSLDVPTGLAFDSSGNLYASNPSRSAYSDSISKFNSSGSYVSSIYTNLSNMSSPWGMAFDSSGNLYVANPGNYTISKFGPLGNFITSWDTGGSVWYLAFKPVSVPEPSTYVLAAIATCTMV